MSESTNTQTRPEHILNERVLMHVRITQNLNKRDDWNNKISTVTWYNDLTSANEGYRALTNEPSLGYLWAVRQYETLNADGTITVEQHQYMWTRKNQWVRKDDKIYVKTPTDNTVRNAQEAMPKDENAPF